MNALQTERRVAANPQTKPTDLGCESAERLAATIRRHRCRYVGLGTVCTVCRIGQTEYPGMQVSAWYVELGKMSTRVCKYL